MQKELDTLLDIFENLKFTPMWFWQDACARWNLRATSFLLRQHKELKNELYNEIRAELVEEIDKYLQYALDMTDDEKTALEEFLSNEELVAFEKSLPESNEKTEEYVTSMPKAIAYPNEYSASKAIPHRTSS